MKRVLLFAVLLAMGLAPSLEAQTQCLNTNGCAPPPCEFLAEIMLAKVRVRNFQSKKELGDREFRAFVEELAPALQKVYPEYFSCSGSLPQIDIASRPICDNPGSAPQAAGRCTEFAEAVSRQQSACETDPSLEFTLADKTLLAEQAKVDSLESSLASYLNSCAPDATLSTQLTDAGLGLLVKGAEKRREDWKAKRAGQNPAYDPNDPLGLR